MATSASRIPLAERDLLLVFLLGGCLILGSMAVSSNIDKREAALAAGGARKVDLVKVRRQILDGTLSPRKALFYRKVPR